MYFEIIKDGVHIDPTDYIFGNSSIVISNTDNNPNTDNNTNTDDNNVPEDNNTIIPKLIYTCAVEDNYYLHLNVGDKLYFSKD